MSQQFSQNKNRGALLRIVSVLLLLVAPRCSPSGGNADGGVGGSDLAGTSLDLAGSSTSPDLISLDLAGSSTSPDLARPLAPAGVFLYTGAGGGGPSTDLYVSMVESVYKSAGVFVQTGTSLPPNFAAQFGVLELLNPMAAVPAEVSNAAIALLKNGGRVVIVMEHCKNGCYGDATDDNALLASLGSTMSLSGMGGGPLAQTTLQLTPVSPITDGVTTLIVYYTGSVNVGSGIALGRGPNGDAIIGYERVGAGDVVVVADSDPFGYVMAKGDDATFVANLAKLR